MKVTASPDERSAPSDGALGGETPSDGRPYVLAQSPFSAPAGAVETGVQEMPVFGT